MAYQVLWQKLAFQKVDPENPTVAVGEVEIVERGGLVPKYVPSFTINALMASGMIVPVADEPDPLLIPVVAEPMQPVGPDTPLVLPTGQSTILEPSSPNVDTEASAPAPVAKPKHTDSRTKWEAYATSPAVGMTEGEAEEYANKADLIAAVEAKEADSAPSFADGGLIP